MLVKETKSKMDNLMYTSSFKPQPYISSLTREQSSLLMALRTRTVRGIRTDYGNMYVDKTCPLTGCQDTDSLSHVLTCRVLQAAVRTVEPAVPVQYGDVFSDCQETQAAATAWFSQLLEARRELTDPII